MKCWIAGMVAITLALAPLIASGNGEAGTSTKTGFTRIVLGSSGGFSGRGTGKGLTIENNGDIVTKYGQKQKKGNLNATELEKLRKLVAAVDWNGVKGVYNSGADMFMSDLSVTTGGKLRETSVSDPRPGDTPKELVALLDYLDTVYKSHKP